MPQEGEERRSRKQIDQQGKPKSGNHPAALESVVRKSREEKQKLHIRAEEHLSPKGVCFQN